MGQPWRCVETRNIEGRVKNLWPLDGPTAGVEVPVLPITLGKRERKTQTLNPPCVCVMSGARKTRIRNGTNPSPLLGPPLNSLPAIAAKECVSSEGGRKGYTSADVILLLIVYIHTVVRNRTGEKRS